MTSFMIILRLICRADGCKNANNCWYFNIYEHDEFHECFKIDIVAYAINMSRLKNLLQTLFSSVLPISLFTEHQELFTMVVAA